MACPNCGDDRVEYDGEMSMRWELLHYFRWKNGYRSGTETMVICEIQYCPFCGEKLLSPDQACVRGCDFGDDTEYRRLIWEQKNRKEKEK